MNEVLRKNIVRHGVVIWTISVESFTRIVNMDLLSILSKLVSLTIKDLRYCFHLVGVLVYLPLNENTD